MECGGCGAPSTHWCDACAAELSVGAGQPHVVLPRIDPQVAVFALGRYAGAAVTPSPGWPRPPSPGIRTSRLCRPCE
jgi:hypothetical protein